MPLSFQKARGWISHFITRQKLKKPKSVNLNSVWHNPIHFIGCGFGVGLIPGMPGTYGTLLGVFIALLLLKFPLTTYIAIVIFLNVLGIWLCGKTNRELGTHDHPAVIWDEIAAFPIVLINVDPSWLNVTVGFILFRIFDIWKPSLIGWADRKVSGGFGVMLDDVLAALLSWGLLQLIIWVSVS